MNPEDREDRESVQYSIRFTLRAQRQIVEAVESLAAFTGDAEAGLIWHEGLLQAIGKLAALPRRWPLEEQFTRWRDRETRRLLFDRHHVYYQVRDSSPDGPQVIVILLRGAQRKPLTRKEARDVPLDL